MNTTWDQLRSRLKELVNPDDSGDREAAEATGGERSEPAILSKEQRGAITHIVNHFHAAIAGMLGSTLQDAAEEARIKQWLDQKYDRLERALHSGEALHFDVLLLGIVPIHLGLVLHNILGRPAPTDQIVSAGKNALDTYQTLYAFSRQAGHRAHVERIVNPLIREYDRSHGLFPGDDGANPWRDQIAGQLDSESFGRYHPLIQYGIKELLRLIKRKVDAAKSAPDGKEEIRRILGEWTPETVVERAKTTFQLAEMCNLTQHGEHSLTCLSSAADPSYLYLLPVPGERSGMEEQSSPHLRTEAASPPSEPASISHILHNDRMQTDETQYRDRSPHAHERFTLPDLGFSAIPPGEAARMRGVTDPNSHHVGRGHNDRMQPHDEHALGAEPRLSERTARRYRVGSDWHERATRRYARSVSRFT